MVTNPFTTAPVAQRYARGRPFYHRFALALATGRLGRSTFRTGLDIGCGTGLSTRALRERTERVVGVDASPAMLRAAEPRPGVGYVAATAERLPLGNASVDISTAGASLHWFDQPAAFAELARVLGPGAPLIVYSDFFHGRLAGRPAFHDWLVGSYLTDYPGPARHAYFDPDVARAAGFTSPTYQEDELQVPLTCAQLADYMLSQSNAAVAIEAGRISAGDLRDQIIEETAEFFPRDHPASAIFGVRVWTTTLRG